MAISKKDRSILRELAHGKAEIAALPVHKQTVAEWTRLNRLEKGRPLVYIYQIPWHEMNVDDELNLRCADDWCRRVENSLRTDLYNWRHLRGDRVVEPDYHSPIVLRDTGFGMREISDVTRTSEKSVASRHFHPQIQSESDVDKIQMPEISVDPEATERNFERLNDLFGDILTVEKTGISHQWFAPWDVLITWYGVQEALTDMALRPALVHAAVERLVGGYLHRLEQYERLNLLSPPDGILNSGSGGLSYTDELPQKGFDPCRVRPIDQWGCATPQIFSEVSPAMHEEFALQYERRWLGRFGLTYYGCCEPLHDKIDILESVPNLRKISMSPRADLAKAAERMGDRYVFSLKPNPAVFATDEWDPAQARRNLREAMERARGCIVEIIMKDVSTVRCEPHRAWEWTDIAVEVAAEFA